MDTRVLRRSGLVVLLGSAILTSGALASSGSPTSSTGSGRVFFPNPVASLEDQTLTDKKDADYAALQPAYRIVTLTHLDGSGYLRGDWANVRSETGAAAFSADNTFIYDRHDDRFEQVMGYFWVTEAQLYLQGLGFGSTHRPINMESQDIRINQLGIDNSYSWDKHDLLRFGKGGVDDAEDAEVILHEYGHAIQDSQMTPFGFGTSVEAWSIGEGFGDYFAVTVSDVVAPTADGPPAWCSRRSRIAASCRRNTSPTRRYASTGSSSPSPNARAGREQPYRAWCSGAHRSCAPRRAPSRIPSLYIASAAS